MYEQENKTSQHMLLMYNVYKSFINLNKINFLHEKRIMYVRMIRNSKFLYE
jgi:hypothetical protein